MLQQSQLGKWEKLMQRIQIKCLKLLKVDSIYDFFYFYFTINANDEQAIEVCDLIQAEELRLAKAVELNKKAYAALLPSVGHNFFLFSDALQIKNEK